MYSVSLGLAPLSACSCSWQTSQSLGISISCGLQGHLGFIFRTPHSDFWESLYRNSDSQMVSGLRSCLASLSCILHSFKTVTMWITVPRFTATSCWNLWLCPQATFLIVLLCPSKFSCSRTDILSMTPVLSIVGLHKHGSLSPAFLTQISMFFHVLPTNNA